MFPMTTSYLAGIGLRRNASLPGQLNQFSLDVAVDPLCYPLADQDWLYHTLTHPHTQDTKVSRTGCTTPSLTHTPRTGCTTPSLTHTPRTPRSAGLAVPHPHSLTHPGLAVPHPHSLTHPGHQGQQDWLYHTLTHSHTQDTKVSRTGCTTPSLTHTPRTGCTTPSLTHTPRTPRSAGLAVPHPHSPTPPGHQGQQDWLYHTLTHPHPQDAKVSWPLPGKSGGRLLMMGGLLAAL